MSIAEELIAAIPGLAWKDLLEEVLPRQGEWTEEQYLVLTDHRNRLVEFTDGFLEALPMLTDKHQAKAAPTARQEPSAAAKRPRRTCWRAFRWM